MHAVLTKLEQHRADPQRRRTLAALKVLLGSWADDHLTADARDLLDFVRHIEGSPLGTQQARELRNQAPPDSVSAVLIRAAELNQAERPVPASADAAMQGLFEAVQHEIDDIATSTMTNLISTAMAGDPSAIESLLIRIQPAIVRYCRFRIGPTSATGYATADDVAQEVCIAVLNELPHYDDEPESFLAFVYQIAASTVTEHHRRQAATTPDPSIDDPSITTHPDADPPQSSSPNPPFGRTPVPKVFVSYAHDSAEHTDSVVAFARLLQSLGIEAVLDVWSAGARQDWAVWAVRAMREADYVIVVASPKYQQMCDEINRDEMHLGVQSEAALVRDLVGGGWAAWMPKVLPVLLPGHNIDEIPRFLTPQTSSHHRVTEFSTAGAKELLRVILNQPRPVTPSVVSHPAADSWRDRLAEMLDALPPRQRDVLQLRTVVGLSAQETAGILGMAPSSVRVTQHRALERLRQKLQGQPGAPGDPGDAEGPSGRGDVDLDGTRSGRQVARGAMTGQGGRTGIPVGVGAGAWGDEDEEHFSLGYLLETTDVFGDECLASPPVIGEDPGDEAK
jgi:RNA polymerase sigma factor (sigma-70 family)